MQKFQAKLEKKFHIHLKQDYLKKVFARLSIPEDVDDI